MHTPHKHTYTPPLITDAESRALVASGRRRALLLCQAGGGCCPLCQNTEVLLYAKEPSNKVKCPRGDACLGLSVATDTRELTLCCQSCPNHHCPLVQSFWLSAIMSCTHIPQRLKRKSS